MKLIKNVSIKRKYFKMEKYNDIANIKLICSVLAAILLGCFCMYSCDNEYNPSVDEMLSGPEHPLNGIGVYGSLLVFKSHAQMNYYIDHASGMDLQELTRFESWPSYRTSQLRMYETIVDAENIHNDLMEDMYGHIENIDSLLAIPEIRHSQTFYRYLERGIIKIVEDEDDYYWDYACAIPWKAAVLDINGMYAVGDTLYQVTNDAFKIWYGVNLYSSDARRILNETIETDSIKGIFVSYVELKRYAIGQKSNVAPIYATSGWNYSGKWRGVIDIRYMSVWNHLTGRPNIHFSVNIKSQENKLLGWKYESGEMVVWGNWRFTQAWKGCDPQQQFGVSLLSRSIPRASNWSFSINPTVPTETHPSDIFYFVHMLPRCPSIIGRLGEYSWGLENFNFTAFTRGGCCGIAHYITNSPGYLARIDLY
jgi:hypothetical protein